MPSPVEKPPRAFTLSSTAAAGYKPPETGIFLVVPASWVPYAELMRLDRQAGFWAFYWHYLIGLAYAINFPSPDEAALSSPFTVVTLAVYLYIWTTVFRGIVCSWNDNLDQEFDRQVARTRNRPIARGAVSTMQGHVFTLGLIIVGVILLIPLPRNAAIHACVEGVLLFIYPLLKRVTDFPQVYLGFGVSLPIFMCCAILYRDPLAQLWLDGISSSTWSIGSASAMFRSSICLYTADVLWTVIYDTVYAHQDYNDDIKAGVQGLAVRLGRKGTKPVLTVLAVIQVSALIAAGQYVDFGALYFISACGGATAALVGMLWQVDLERPESCAYWFGPGSRAVGGSVVLGLVGEYAGKLMNV